MGSGASNPVQEGMKDKSVDEIAAALKDLPAESYAKIADAMKGLEETTEAAPTSAPFLKKAFDTMNKAIQLCMAGEMTGEEPSESQMDALEKEYNGYLKQSFQHHDKDSSGKLDKEQAALFFSNLLSEGGGFMDVMCASLMNQGMKHMKTQIKQALVAAAGEEMATKWLPGACKIVEGEFKKVEDACKENTDKVKAEYKANKAEKDAAAMNLTDTDGSGSLDLEEFMKMMDVQEELNHKLMMCLGLNPDPSCFMETIDMEGLGKKMEEFMQTKMTEAK